VILVADPVTEARKALAAAGLPAAADGLAGSASIAGYQVTPLVALGPDRAAVRWQPPAGGDCPPGPGAGLARCQQALRAAGCRCTFVVAPGGGYLAVLAPVPPAAGRR